MEEPSQELCEVCGERPASHFVCRMSSRRLCGSCHEASLAGYEKGFFEALKKGRCRFCGSPAVTVDSMSSILDGPGAEPRFLCGSCSWQYNRLMLGRMNPAVQEMEELSKTEQMDHLRRIVADLDAGMQAWVRQRDN